MTVYVHTTVHDEAEAQKATQQLLDAGFPSRDIELIECDHRHTRRARLRARTRAFTGAGLGTALGAIIGSLAFTQPGLWPDAAADLTISTGAALGAFIGLVAGGLAGLGVLRTVPRVAHHPHPIAVGVHTDQPRVSQATEALKQFGAREIVAGTEREAAQRLADAA